MELMLYDSPPSAEQPSVSSFWSCHPLKDGKEGGLSGVAATGEGD